MRPLRGACPCVECEASGSRTGHTPPAPPPRTSRWWGPARHRIVASARPASSRSCARGAAMPTPRLASERRTVPDDDDLRIAAVLRHVVDQPLLLLHA